ncbi:xylan alpha-glucuronosyltransferase 1-like [Hordeum vulgare]|nr:xylan alpha-glucuronosyltransferase 1-like [Hordeum vulgare]
MAEVNTSEAEDQKVQVTKDVHATMNQEALIGANSPDNSTEDIGPSKGGREGLNSPELPPTSSELPLASSSAANASALEIAELNRKLQVSDEDLDRLNGRFDEKQAQDKELEKLRAKVERAKREAISHNVTAEQAIAELDALKAVRKQYEVRVMEVQQELEEVSLKCEAFEQKSKDQAAEQTKLSAEIQLERVERRFFEEEVRQVKLMATDRVRSPPASTYTLSDRLADTVGTKKGMQEPSDRKEKMAAHAPLSPEARSRAAILPLLRILEDHGVDARKSRPAATSSKAGRKKKVLLLTVVVSIAFLCALLKTRTLSGRILLHNPPAPTISIPRPPYAAHRRVRWDSVTASLVAAQAGSVALLNFSPAEVKRWRKLRPLHTTVRAVRLQAVDRAVTWAALYPEWIDEDGNGTSSGRCPSLPEPEDQGGRRFDLVAVNLPCRSRNDSGSWSRDVDRLHLQLSAAKLAVSVHSSHVLLVSDCLPLPNLFPCKHLLHRHGHARLYRAHAAYLRPRTRLPVGSCDLALRLPTSPTKPLTVLRRRREAYATVLHSSDAYVCGAIAVAQSIRQSGSTRDLVALVDYGSIGADQRAGLTAAGWQVRAMDGRIRNPHAVPGTYNEWNYSKLRLWQQLTDYRRIVFVDADQLVLRNIDFLFDAPEVSATGNSRTLFNSGVMVLEPCNCTFDMLMARVRDVRSYNGGDQGFFNEIFTWWHRLPRTVNVLKYYHQQGHAGPAASAPPSPEPYLLHYLGIKPWLCFRDYDCNWNVPSLRQFANDEAHARWWTVHDRIAPRELATKFCAIPGRQRSALEYDRRQAEMDNATDMHWSRPITDPRNTQQLLLSMPPTA